MLEIFTKEKASIHEIELAIKNAEEVNLFNIINLKTDNKEQL